LKLLWSTAVLAALVACQPKPQPIDQALLRDDLLRGMSEPPSAAAERLRLRGFACQEAAMAWSKGAANIGCSRNNGGNFLNVELAGSASGGRLAGYRMYETPQPLYRAAPKQ
jgi:hypothetical protein